MKILSKSLILFSIVTLGFTACSENEQLADDSLSKVPVLLTTRLTAMDADATRAGVSLNESMLEKGNVGVWLSSVGYDTKYTYTAASGGALSSESPAYYPTSGTTDIVAVYPASAITADASQATAFAVLADQTLDANYEASDLMSGKLTEKSKTSGVQSIPLAHKMAKVIVNITPGAGVASITSVTLNNIKRQITYTASTDVLGQAEQILGTDVSVGTNNCAAVIPPQTIAASTDFLTIVTDAGTAVYQFKTAKELLTGNYYQLNITVNRTATLGVNTIEAWDGSGSANVAATTTEGGLTIASDIAEQTYTGSAICPEITVVKRTGEDDPLDAALYDVYYANNINAGTATVYAVGKGTEAGKMGKKEFTINKADGTISYSKQHLDATVDDAYFSTVKNNGDGTVTYSSSDTGVATVDENTGEVTPINAGSVTITATVVDGSNYTYAEKTASYTVTVLNNLRNNPLWWVARYNQNHNGTAAETSHSTSEQYVFPFSDAFALSSYYYHLPHLAEFSSVVPKGTGSSSEIYVNELTGTLDEPSSYVEMECNVGGTSVPSSTSYFGKKAQMDYYAVRFIGTKYASVWHYKWITFPCRGLLIESYQMPSTTTVDEAKAILATYSYGGAIFTGVYDSGSPNLYPSTSMSNNQSATGFTQRFFPACGIFSEGGPSHPNTSVGDVGSYWTATSETQSTAWTMNFTFSSLNEKCESTSHSRSVRLFYNP